MIPYSTVEPIKDKYAGFQSDQLDVDAVDQLLRRRLVDVPVAIRARLGGASDGRGH
jgi:flagellar motor switch protein FliM